jgi:regulator of replication initiation timing
MLKKDNQYSDIVAIGGANEIQEIVDDVTALIKDITTLKAINDELLEVLRQTTVENGELKNDIIEKSVIVMSTQEKDNIYIELQKTFDRGGSTYDENHPSQWSHYYNKVNQKIHDFDQLLK